MTEQTEVPTVALFSPDQINDMRKRVLAGEEFPADEYRNLIRSYRACRLAGQTTSATKTAAKTDKATKNAPVDLNALLGNLGL
jgi:hypothetical protein